MAKHFDPAEIRSDNCKGYSTRQVTETLRHYGFIVATSAKSGGHLRVRHREYNQLFHLLAEEGLNGQQSSLTKEGMLNIAMHDTHADPIVVQKAAVACLKVKELNARRREQGSHEPLPDWVKNTLPGDFRKRMEGDILRLFAEPNGTARRSYEISYEKDKIKVVNLNYPDEYHMSFSWHEGDHNPHTSFRRQFDQLDKDVQGHIKDRETYFNQLLERTEKNRRFTITRDDPDRVEMPMIHLRHPLYHISADLPLTPPNETIANETIYALESLRKQHDALYEEQYTVLDELAQKGWSIAQTSSTADKEGQIAFSHPSGRAFTLSLLGDLQMFDMEAAREQAAELQTAPEMQIWAGGRTTSVVQAAKRRA